MRLVLSALFDYELFAEKGYNASMADISNLVGIKVQSIYSHYKSKDEIVKLMLEKEMISRHVALNAVLDEAISNSCEDGLKSIYFSICEYYKDLKRLRFWRNISLIADEELRV